MKLTPSIWAYIVLALNYSAAVYAVHSPVLQVIFTLNYAVCVKVRNRQQ
jgi:hypothetical protein